MTGGRGKIIEVETAAPFAARGRHCDPIIVSKITTRSGKNIAVPSANCKQVMDEAVADGVVVGDQAAHRDPCVEVEQRQDRLGDVTTDVLEVDVDPVRHRLGQPAREVRVAVVDRGVEAELLQQRPALLRPAGDADRPGALELGDLPDGRSDRPGGRGDDDGLPGLRLADLQEPGVCREAGHPQHAQGRRHRCRRRVQPARIVKQVRQIALFAI